VRRVSLQDIWGFSRRKGPEGEGAIWSLYKHYKTISTALYKVLRALLLGIFWLQIELIVICGWTDAEMPGKAA
jgi:hypothetical protein